MTSPEHQYRNHPDEKTQEPTSGLYLIGVIFLLPIVIILAIFAVKYLVGF